MMMHVAAVTGLLPCWPATYDINLRNVYLDRCMFTSGLRSSAKSTKTFPPISGSILNFFPLACIYMHEYLTSYVVRPTSRRYRLAYRIVVNSSSRLQ